MYWVCTLSAFLQYGLFSIIFFLLCSPLLYSTLADYANCSLSISIVIVGIGVLLVFFCMCVRSRSHFHCIEFELFEYVLLLLRCWFKFMSLGLFRSIHIECASKMITATITMNKETHDGNKQSTNLSDIASHHT